MLIGYRNAQLRKTCEDHGRASKRLPDERHVRDFFRRLDQLHALPTLADVPPEKPFRRHKLKGKRKNQWAISIRGAWRICVQPADPYELTEQGSIDLATVTSIIIVDVDDYWDESHGTSADTTSF
ncbi:MAG: hypothetical protein MAG453_00763 [Calditrichaeota bacterium]|nr:hypothetical protein [Calditrichota bacterium]